MSLLSHTLYAEDVWKHSPSAMLTLGKILLINHQQVRIFIPPSKSNDMEASTQ